MTAHSQAGDLYRRCKINASIQDVDNLNESLPVLPRLTLSYCPASARPETLALLALDARLAGIVRSASEPMLAQIRLAWWRDLFQNPVEGWPDGEPLLASLACWKPRKKALAKLVDGWEAITDEGALSVPAMDHLASSRGDAFATLASLLGAEADCKNAARMGRNWAFADLVSRLSNAEERNAALGVARQLDWAPVRLSRKMRPLVILHGLAARNIRRGGGFDTFSPVDLLLALRLGLLGR